MPHFTQNTKGEHNDYLISTFYGIINYFVSFFKFTVFFILYIFVFFYSGNSFTFPISILLLLILHIMFAGGGWFGQSQGNLAYQDFFFNIFDIEKKDKNVDKTLFYFYQALKYIIYVGPFASWVFLLASIALVIDFLNRLGFYNEKSDIFKYLNDQHRQILDYIIIFFTLSINILFILYGISYSGVIRNPTPTTENNENNTTNLNTTPNKDFINLDWITYTPVRLLSTTILFFSFFTYYFFTGFNENYIFGFGIGLCILFYLLNIVMDDKFKKNIDKEYTRDWNAVILIFLTINIMGSIGAIPVIYLLFKYIIQETHAIFIPIVTLFCVSVYNLIVNILYIFKTNGPLNINIKLIVSLIICFLIAFSSTTLYFSVFLNENIKVITDI